MSPVLGVALSGGAIASPKNLLLWTEEFDNAAWTKTDVTIVADADGVADRATFGTSGGATLAQTTTVAAAAGATASLPISPTANYVRYDLGGTFDSQLYTVSLELKSAAADAVTLSIFRTGGFLAVQLLSQDDIDTRVILVKNAQLERGTLTDYVHRTT